MGINYIRKHTKTRNGNTINGEKKLTSTVEQPLQCKSSIPTPKGGEEPPTTRRGGDGGVARKKTGAGTKWGREEEETKRVRDAGCTLFLIKFKTGTFLLIHVKCWVHQQYCWVHLATPS